MSAKRQNAIGSIFGKWTVIGNSPSTRDGQATNLCKCECGTVRAVRSVVLRRGGSLSCGCIRETNPGMKPRHGMCKTPTYRSWAHMLSRCNNEKHHAYMSYGGRGIKACDRWHIFENFLADMGERPEGKSIDRIDNNGDYTPENCRWATGSEQQKNKRPFRKKKPPRTILTKSQVDEIRADVAAGIGYGYKAKKAREIGVSAETIRCLIIGKTWAGEYGHEKA